MKDDADKNQPELLHVSRLVTLGELAASFAHEVFNPLMIIRGHLHFIEQGIALEHPIKENLEVIKRASKRIEKMAGRMLDFGRKRARQVELCEIEEVISVALDLVRPYILARGIDCRVDVEAGLPKVSIDRWEIVQALINLLKNSVDAMAGVAVRRLSIEARKKEALTIRVSDTGMGIAPPDLSRLFEPFFTTKGERGTGLGLPITRKIIQDHKGSISVESLPGSGTTFTISLPLE